MAANERSEEGHALGAALPVRLPALAVLRRQLWRQGLSIGIGHAVTWLIAMHGRCMLSAEHFACKKRGCLYCFHYSETHLQASCVLNARHTAQTVCKCDRRSELGLTRLSVLRFLPLVCWVPAEGHLGMAGRAV